MEQLTVLDTSFLNLETATTYGHVSGLAIFDPSRASVPATVDDIECLIEERIHLLPPFRRRLVEVPSGRWAPVCQGLEEAFDGPYTGNRKLTLWAHPADTRRGMREKMTT